MIKAQIADLIHFDSPYWRRVYHIHVVGVLGVSIFIRDSVMSMFLAWGQARS